MHYKFKVGEQFKINDYGWYSHHQIPIWSPLVVKEIDESTLRMFHEGTQTDVVVRKDQLTMPVGYKEVYDVRVRNQDEAQKIKTWMTIRDGLSVFVSHDLSCPGEYVFCPGDGFNTRPNWRMVLVEVLSPAETHRVKILLEETSSTKPKGYRGDWTYDRRCREYWRYVDITKETFQ